MAYFQRNRYNREDQDDFTDQEETYAPETWDEPTEYDYDDGFDELTEPDEDEEAEEMDPEQRKNRIRFAMGAGNLVSVIVGTVAVLVLLTLLLSMYNFVSSDLTRNLALFQTKF